VTSNKRERKKKTVPNNYERKYPFIVISFTQTAPTPQVWNSLAVSFVFFSVIFLSFFYVFLFIFFFVASSSFQKPIGHNAKIGQRTKSQNA